MLAAGLAIIGETKAAADSIEVFCSGFKMAVLVEFPHLARCDGQSDAAQEGPVMKSESEGDFCQGG